MKICKKCGNGVLDDARFCNKCGSNLTTEEQVKQDNEKIKNKPNKYLTIVIVIAIILLLGGIVLLYSKDNILYSYYKSKGDKESSTTSSIEYYVDALQIKYTDEIINSINNKILEDENFEDNLINLKGIIKEQDLNNIYIKAYIKKAKENFNNKNYETTLSYLNKAQNYNYNIETFEYYNDLIKYMEENDTETNEEQAVNQDIYYIYKNDEPIYISEDYGYYIIPDSSTRKLSKSELYRYDSYTLGLIRNEIFARHGYIFNKQQYKDYFNSMPWYTPNPSFSGSLDELNSIERYNVELIKSME